MPKFVIRGKKFEAPRQVWLEADPNGDGDVSLIVENFYVATLKHTNGRLVRLHLHAPVTEDLTGLDVDDEGYVRVVRD